MPKEKWKLELVPRLFEMQEAKNIVVNVNQKAGEDSYKACIDALEKKLGTDLNLKGLFIGEAAVKEGLITFEQLQHLLNLAPEKMILAAVEDMRAIADGNLYEAASSPFVKNPHWGNDPDPTILVNKPIPNPSVRDAATAAANIGKVITILSVKAAETIKSLENGANEGSPDEAKEHIQALKKQLRGFQEGVVGMKSLTLLLLHGDKSEHPLKHAVQYVEKAENALKAVVQGWSAKDLGMKEQTTTPLRVVHLYIQNRFTDIQKGLEHVPAQAAQLDNSRAV